MNKTAQQILAEMNKAYDNEATDKQENLAQQNPLETILQQQQELKRLVEEILRLVGRETRLGQ